MAEANDDKDGTSPSIQSPSCDQAAHWRQLASLMRPHSSGVQALQVGSAPPGCCTSLLHCWAISRVSIVNPAARPAVWSNASPLVMVVSAMSLTSTPYRVRPVITITSSWSQPAESTTGAVELISPFKWESAGTLFVASLGGPSPITTATAPFPAHRVAVRCAQADQTGRILSELLNGGPPTSYKSSYNPYKWVYKWVTGVISPLCEKL